MPHRRHASPKEEGPAVIAAGARLEAMRRRVRLSRVAVWTVIAAGPVALAVAVTSTPTTTVATAQDRSTDARSVTAVAADPAGYAQVFMTAWLRSSADDTATAQARLAQSMAPDVELPAPASDAQPAPASVTAVRSAHTGAGSWSVTVAVQYPDGLLRYFAVPVTTDTAGTSFAVTGTPAVVAGPRRAEPPESPYTVQVGDGELTRAWASSSPRI
ncbi:conjugal transfer protein [Streptomyces justiciae]|uniref:Conjugal transfer protein n=1 Tax=Streptomyces justiciae TaxID=2780140 RepID=A0ABU3M7I2_9ACTN|nr:conjugal transfer protein [Streptomyces justiciae]MDT7847482.1 conjugal transfer protein [Streptomyces justiciae]